METSIIKKLPGAEVLEEVMHKNGGFCLCKPNHDATTKCPCQEFRDQFMGDCTCGLYTKIPADYIIFTREGCPRCNILKKELDRMGKNYVESTEYPDGVVELPVLMTPFGMLYNYRGALDFLNAKEVSNASKTNN